jgi:hypothetical protein
MEAQSRCPGIMPRSVSEGGDGSSACEDVNPTTDRCKKETVYP